MTSLDKAIEDGAQAHVSALERFHNLATNGTFTIEPRRPRRPARSLSPRARIAAQVESVHWWRCGCGTTIGTADWDRTVAVALDHADNCIESDHEGEA